MMRKSGSFLSEPVTPRHPARRRLTDVFSLVFMSAAVVDGVSFRGRKNAAAFSACSALHLAGSRISRGRAAAVFSIGVGKRRAAL